MARKIPLKTVMIANGPNGPSPFVWAEMLQVILKSANPQKGLTMDEVLIAVDAMKPLDKAVESGDDFVTFSETQYRLLREKLDTFAFGIATPEVAEFGLAVRDAKEIT
jgi:hypothetical protein